MQLYQLMHFWYEHAGSGTYPWLYPVVWAGLFDRVSVSASVVFELRDLELSYQIPLDHCIMHALSIYIAICNSSYAYITISINAFLV